MLEGFNFSANYNVFADSFKLSLISGSGSSRIFKGYTTLYYGITMDPYGRTLLNGKEIRSQSYALNLNKKLVYLTSSFININTNINIGQLIGLFNKEILNKKTMDKQPYLNYFTILTYSILLISDISA